MVTNNAMLLDFKYKQLIPRLLAGVSILFVHISEGSPTQVMVQEHGL